MATTLTDDQLLELARAQQVSDTSLLVKYLKMCNVTPDTLTANVFDEAVDSFREAYLLAFSRECHTHWCYTVRDEVVEFHTTFTEESLTSWLNDIDRAGSALVEETV